jgi:periplasmic divalent cation tolerance protein
MDFVFAYITTKDKTQALSIGQTLVEERLAACVNVISSDMTSIYRWEGKICTDSEAVLIAKTSAQKFPLLTERVKQLHTYTCPCIVSLPVTGGSKDYLNWLEAQLGT